MSYFGSDTPPEIEARLIGRLRDMTPQQRLQKAFSASAALWEMMAAQVRARHPTATEREVRLRIASRTIPRDLLVAATGWDVDRQGY